MLNQGQYLLKSQLLSSLQPRQNEYRKKILILRDDKRKIKRAIKNTEEGPKRRNNAVSDNIKTKDIDIKMLNQQKQ